MEPVVGTMDPAGPCRDGSPGGNFASLGGGGGGQVHIAAMGLVVNGTIAANGGPGVITQSSGPPTPGYGGGGGGSGGCINILLHTSMATATVSASTNGMIEANGGSGRSGGGGGRIMIAVPKQKRADADVRTAWLTAVVKHMAAVGGLSQWCSSPTLKLYGAAGTKYISNNYHTDPSTSQLKVDNLLEINGNGLETTDVTTVYTPLAHKFWIMPAAKSQTLQPPSGIKTVAPHSPCPRSFDGRVAGSLPGLLSLYIRNAAYVHISEEIGKSTHIDSLHLLTGSYLQRCTLASCEYPSPDNSEHVTVAASDTDSNMMLHVGTIEVRDGGTTLNGENLTICCTTLAVASDFGDKAQIVSGNDETSGIYVYANESINVGAGGSIGYSTLSSTNEVLLRCANFTGSGCPVNIGGIVAADFVNVTGETVRVEETGIVHGAGIASAACADPLSHSCDTFARINGSNGVFLSANSSEISGIVQGGVVFICPYAPETAHNVANKHLNRPVFNNKVVLSGDARIEALNGCPPSFGLGSPNSSTFDTRPDGGAGHGDVGGYGASAENGTIQTLTSGGTAYDRNDQTSLRPVWPPRTVHAGSGGGGSQGGGTGGGLVSIVAHQLILREDTPGHKASLVPTIDTKGAPATFGGDTSVPPSGGCVCTRHSCYGDGSRVTSYGSRFGAGEVVALLLSMSP
jgi:hypothetical protein